MRWEDGALISRVQIRKLLGDAGEDLGISRRDTGTHSFRIAGATAVYSATGGSKKTTQRIGRWSSDALQRYVWKDASLTKGLAGRMLRAPWSPHMAAFG